MGDTSIQWADKVWNPVRGCSRVSAGCGDSTGGGCYAERQAYRFSGVGQAYEGLVRMTSGGPRWTGVVKLIEEHLEDPLRWKTPRRIFVNSMSDLFHENFPYESIIRIFDVMRRTPWHTFQILTKRQGRLYDFCSRLRFDPVEKGLWLISKEERDAGKFGTSFVTLMRHCWFGVSIENQETADERIPLLLRTPAVVRFVSYEPALGPVRFDWLGPDGSPSAGLNALTGEQRGPHESPDSSTWGEAISWLICGGESGPGARPFDIQWARDVIAQCKAAGVKCFFKQAGSNPFLDGKPLRLKNRKGSDLAELAGDLQVREYPA